jgi:hypothetical protein
VLLLFYAQANQSYTVEYRASVDSGGWVRLADVPAEPLRRWVFVSDEPPTATRFYRLRAP